MSSQVSDEQILRAYRQVSNHAVVFEQFKGKPGISRDRIRRVCKIGGYASGVQADVKSVSEIPDADIPMEELHRRKYEDFNRIKANQVASKVFTIRLKTNRPIGLGWMGDPHLDDNGCDLKLVHEHSRIIRETDGLYGVNVGDNLNLWVGRLFRLYGECTTTISDGYRLFEDLIVNQVGIANWLALIFGNHDIWGGGSHPLTWMQKRNGLIIGKYNVRLRLLFPNGREVYIWLRHDFPGNSQWNDLHGLTKQALMGAPFHLFVAGHKHTSAYHSEYNENNGLHWHALRVGSYKEVDEYPDELALKNKNNYKCPVTIIDPTAKTELQLIKFEADTADGADRLKWLRAKRG
jgi:hypothetical protein